MAQVEEIKFQIEKLTDEEYSRLRQWFVEKEWMLWDKQIEEHSGKGKLDFIIEEAIKEKERGNLKPL
jgi:hypothetical protein